MPYKKSSEHGGPGGSPFSDNLTQVCRLVGMNIRHGGEIDAIQPVWEMVGGTILEGPVYGGIGGKLDSFEMHQDEYIVRVEGRYGNRIDSLKFISNKGRDFGPFGGGGGKAFEVEHLQVCGFFGRYGTRLDAIGFFSPTKC